MQPKRPPQLVLVDIPDEVATPLADALDKTRDRSLETQREVGGGGGREGAERAVDMYVVFVVQRIILYRKLL